MRTLLRTAVVVAALAAVLAGRPADAALYRAPNGTDSIGQAGVHYDAQGRVSAAWVSVGWGGAAGYRLHVSRTTTAGYAADTTWGTQGLQTTSITPPANCCSSPPDTGMTPDGSITVLWPGCGNNCQGVTVERYSTSGSLEGSVSLESPNAPLGDRAVLNDGSVLGKDDTLGTKLLWFGPSGALRANLTVTNTEVLMGAAVRDGKLYVTLTNFVGNTSRLVRVSAAGAAEKSFSVPFGAISSFPLNARGLTPLPGPGGTAGVAITNTGTPEEATIRLYDANGTFQRSVSTPAALGELRACTSGLVEADGDVIVGCSDGYAFSFVQRIPPSGSGTTWEVAFGGRYVDAILPTSGPRVAGVATNREWNDSDPLVESFSWDPTPPVTVQPPTSAPSPPSPSNPHPTTIDVTSPVVSGFGNGGRGDPPTGYRFFLYEGTSATPVQTKDATAAVRKVTFTGLTAGVRYRFKAAAFNTGGVGPSSGYSSFVLLPFLNFDTFTTRQYLDFAGRNPTTAEKNDWNTKLTNGTLTAAGAVNTAVDFGHHQKQSPVIRLFRAYFLRLPDKGGLDYWTTKHRAGTTLNTISQSFAGSAEFKTRYGSLTNQAFVELVYANVLGRPGEPAGVTYWTGELEKGTKTRGQVMAGFSESGEYKNKTKALVDTVNTYTGMLRRIPTSGEAATWAPSTNPPTRLALITHILATTEYDNRV